MSGHSKLSPSGAHRWLVCPGSVPLSAGLVDTTSVHAAEGTRAHELAAHMLEGRHAELLSFEPDADMWDYVQVYVNEIQRRADGNMLLVEQRVSPEPIIGTKDCDGTADAVILDMQNKTIEVHDLKFGKGHMVYAADNPQLLLYGLGALASYDYILEAERVRLFIHQPRRDHLDDVVLTREQLLEFGSRVKAGAQQVNNAVRCQNNMTPGEFRKAYLKPDDDACRWCRAKAVCPALGNAVQTAVFDDFDVVRQPEDLDPLPDAEKLSLIEGWVAAVRAYIRGKLDDGEAVPGWKLVEGRKGARKWDDTDKVGELVRSLRIKVGEAFDMKLKTPPQLEKIVPKKKWEQLEAHITQADPSLSMVAESDKRPAYTPGSEF